MGIVIVNKKEVYPTDDLCTGYDCTISNRIESLHNE